MRKFEFRLQRVLDYRHLLEGWAKDALREAQAALVDAEQELEAILAERAQALKRKQKTLEAMVEQETFVLKLEDDAETQRSVIAILADEVERATNEWIEAKRAVETMEKLKQRELEIWETELAREEQKALDDWTNTRRPA